MALPEIEFELPASQYERMNYPGLTQGRVLSVTLDGGLLLPDPEAERWYAVQQPPLEKRFVRVGPGVYAFAGQITEADIEYGREQLAFLAVDCGEVILRVTCGPQEDGQLPYGTWETRYIAGLANVQGIVEDSFQAPVGRTLDVTVWSFRRLCLTPGDVAFGAWQESVELPPAPYVHDRVYVVARVHRWRTVSDALYG
ncbi:MAG: hypothetical protein D6790_18445 [Caldilineae bacterium]|nr:MAG: hypothetical protein D6790_18445 [Caldilineae bacterium]